MRTAVLIALKDLQRQLRDRPAVAAGLIAPVVLALLAVTSLGRLNGSFHANYLVVDQGTGVTGQLLVDGVREEAAVRRIIDIRQEPSLERAQDAVAQGEATAAFVFPADFVAAIYRNDPRPIRLLLDPANPVGSEFAKGIAEQFESRISSTQLATATALSLFAPGSKPNASDVALLASRLDRPLVLDDDLLRTRRQSSLAAYFAPSMAIVGLLVVVQMAARSLLEERRQGTLSRLRSFGATPRQILAGKAMAGTYLGMSTMLTTLVAVGLLTGARWGNPVLVLVLCLATVVAFLAAATLVTAVAATEDAAATFGLLAGTLLAFVGGNFIPLSQAPGPLVRLSALTPNGWALRGFQELQLGHAGMADIAPSLAALGGFSIGFGLPAFALVRWRMR